MFYFYILYSANIDRYYIGHTNNLSERIRKHNSKHKGFTGQTDDWVLVYLEEYETKSQAYQRERQVKNLKSKKAIVALIERQKKHPTQKNREGSSNIL